MYPSQSRSLWWYIRAQGVEEVLSNQVPSTKILHNGQVLILRGEKTYTLQGQEVK